MKETRTRTRGKRLARRIAAVTGIVLGVAVVSGILALSLPSVRARLLRTVIARVDEALPGTLAVESARWPSPGTIELAGVAWDDSTVALVRADRVRVALGPRSLLFRDANVEDVEIDGAYADVAAIAERTAQPEREGAPNQPRRRRPSFPREGAVAGLPSFAVHHLVAGVDSIRTGGGVLTGVEIVASADLLRGHAPTARLDRLHVRGGVGAGSWSVDSMSVDVDLASGRVDGRARGRLSPYWPFTATLSSDRPDRVTVLLGVGEGDGPPAGAGIRLVVDAARQAREAGGAGGIGALVVRADIRTPGTSELARDPALAARVAGLPDLEGVGADASATIALAPAIGVVVDADVQPNTWLRGGRLEATYRGDTLSVTRAQLSLDGLEASGSLHLAGDSLVAAAAAEVTGGVWLETLRPGSRAPGAMAGGARVFVRAARPFDRVDVGVLGRGGGYHAGASLELERGQGISARVSPIVVQTSPLPSPPALGAGDETMVRRSPAGDLSVKNLLVTGAAGRVRIDATLDASKDGTFSVGARWPSAPPLLLSRLRLDRARVRALSADWSRDGPFRLAADGSFHAGSAPRSARVRATFDLPGPRTLASLLPDSARTYGLGPVRGRIDADAREGERGFEVSAAVDLGQTSWIDTARAEVRVRGGGVDIDTLVVAVDSLRAASSGVLRGDSLDATVRATVAGADFLRRFSPGLPELSATLVARATGATRSPEVEADVDAVVSGVALSGHARLAPTGSSIRVHAPDGIRTPYATFDVARASLDSKTPALFPARVTLDAAGTGLSLHQAATISLSGGVTAAVDTFGVTLGARDLKTNAPFVVRVLSDSSSVEVEGLDMSGTLGSASLSGVASPTRTRLEGALSVRMPGKPESLALPAGLWPDAMDATIHADTLGVIRAEVAALGIRLADGRRPAVAAEVDAAPGRVRARLAVAEPSDTLLVVRAVLPATLTIVPPSLRAVEGTSELDVRARGLPLALQSGAARNLALVDGRAHLSGPPESPAGSLEATATFPGIPKLDSYRLHVEATADTSRTAAGVTASVGVEREGRRVLEASVEHPARVSLAPPFVSVDTSGTVRVHVDSDALALGELDPLLPPDVGLGGSLRLRFDATGAPSDPALDGRIDADKVEVTHAQQLRIVASGDVQIGGTAKRPSARGDIVIENGLIRIPEPQQELLPASGTALLLEGGETVVDSTAAKPPKEHAARGGGDIDVRVRIPSGLWIRGQGLEAELAGDLHIRQSDGRPTLTGTLRAVRGNLVFLGRSFQLDRGSVVFYGDDENDPSLDVRLSATVDGVVVHVEITGTALKPELSLQSEPDMQEGDIMSYLVFGKPLDTLDQDQVSLVERRATEIAAAMGAVKLQEGLSRQLGIDMVTIRSGVAADEASAIVVGKYLSPRLLVKYERLLEEQAAQFINIEYLLTRRLKIETLYGRQDQQGIEIEWSNEY